MTEATINTIALTAIFFGQAFATWQTTRTAAKQAAAKAALDSNTKRLESKVDVIHAQTNSMRLAALRTAAIMARRVAAMTKLEADAEIANHAETELRNAESDAAEIPQHTLDQAGFKISPPTRL